jgi:GTPase SAR1 family protein
MQVNELTIKCQVWDVVMNADENDRGESMKGLGDSLCKKAAAVMLLFDVTDRPSFERLERGIRELKTVVGEGTVIAVIGNKTDLEEQ